MKSKRKKKRRLITYFREKPILRKQLSDFRRKNNMPEKKLKQHNNQENIQQN
jgi:hypothetical protein